MSIRIGDNIVSGSSMANSVRDVNNTTTPIYNWTGTLNEYNALGTYNPNWLYYITDDFITGGTAGGRNIGDIFYSMRTDISLSGAVRCNGNTYYIEDFTGTESIGNLLSSGKLPYISLDDYAAEIADHGNCGKFGWDGGNSNAFRVPTLNDVFLEASNSSNGSFVSAGLPNITGDCSQREITGTDTNVLTESTGAFYNSGQDRPSSAQLAIDGNYQQGTFGFDASRSSSIYGNSTTVQPASVKYSAFVQLTTGTTDIALETCSTMSAQVAANVTSINILNEHRVIEFQAPTADNNYTWYRKYSDGWIEQGGMLSGSTSNVIFPKTMFDTNYIINLCWSGGKSSTFYSADQYINNISTTGFDTNGPTNVNVKQRNWEVKGMYAQE